MSCEVLIVRTGVANIASVMAGLQRQGAQVRLTEDPADVAGAQRLVLPGVGAFGAAMAELHSRRLVTPLRERIQAGRPTLAVCLGLQLLAQTSEESPGVEGLGVFPGTVKRFRGDVRIPQLGWNRIEPEEGCALLQTGHVYFANSYRLAQVPSGWKAAWSDHGGRFIAAIERGPVLGCQFHPELSGSFGRDLIARWLEAGG